MRKLLLFTIVLLLFILSCKKEILVDVIKSNKRQLTIIELQQALSKNANAHKTNSSNKIGAVREPDWLNAYSLSLKNGSNILYVPLSRHEYDVKNGTQSRLVAYRDSLGEIQSAIMILKPEKLYLELNNWKTSAKTFTGDVMIFTTDHEFMRGLIFDNGKIIGQVKLQTATIDKRENPKKIQSYEWECEWRQGGGYLNEYGELVITLRKYCRAVFVQDPYTPPEYEYLNPTDLGWDAGGGGGQWVPEESQMKIKYDTLNRDFPCAVKLILNKLVQDTVFNKLLFPFTSSFNVLPDLNITHSQQIWGSNNNYSLGTTEYSQSWDANIKINTSALQSASQLFIASTIIHESAHAYSNYYITTGAYGTPVSTADSTWAMKIVNYEQTRDNYINGGNYLDHSVFLENYFDNMVHILSRFGGNNYTLEQYRMTVLYGLNNAGIPPNNQYALIGYNLLKSKLQKSYNNIIAKYNINTTTMNSFWSQNTVNTPSSKKLPSNCP